ncbi:hypothetical protein CHLRE_06g279300v5 [Chlamydomonas reinhardtii]|uniref:Uncharacterized protein n=1 Tax=Chlamydomonas reinhardtii TaxID=3055 RepID=A0A2K3DPH5_CHLRE|nr:uncharacterized protein CHLRE_06g279300v5 [Chlamydomonas reinhardtii]PNW82446.1 hypothetical protein CHLRE_06g279300v5 [Chlamydomonas reinhardtii]
MADSDIESRAASPDAAKGNRICLDELPDEILIQIFGHLSEVGNTWDEDDPLRLGSLPYHQADLELLPCTGLRGYPFLAQVCRKWRRLLSTPIAQTLCWRKATVDFGHELVTSIHTPLRWSNQRPTRDEYETAFQQTSISAAKVLGFLRSLGPVVQSLTFSNSEGYDGEEGEYISLSDKHDFGPSHLGFAIAMLANTLTELRLYRCNDLVVSDQGLLGLLPLLPHLRVLGVEGLRSRVSAAVVAPLGDLRKLDTLVLSGAQYRSGDWTVGLDGLPHSWSRLTGLTRLELRGHQQLLDLPGWFAAALKGLRVLDVSSCSSLALGQLSHMTQLEVLVLQHLNLAHALPTAAEMAALLAAGGHWSSRTLPDLTPLARSLRSLSLSCNRLGLLPEWLPKMTRLEHLDLSYNKDLHIRAPLTGLAALPHLVLLDFRHVHVVEKTAYWPEAKCVTMQHLTKLVNVLKRRQPQPRVLLEM